MIQVKIFSETCLFALEERLNDFLKKECRRVRDIQFTRDNNISCVMVIYEDNSNKLNEAFADISTDVLKKIYY